MQITQIRQRKTEPVLIPFTRPSEDEKLDRIYRNCRSKINLYTRSTGFETLTQFLTLAEEVEEIEASESQTRVEQPRQQQLRPDVCMRCGRTGHAARTCGNLDLRKERHENNRILQTGIGKRSRSEQLKLRLKAQAAT